MLTSHDCMRPLQTHLHSPKDTNEATWGIEFDMKRIGQAKKKLTVSVEMKEQVL